MPDLVRREDVLSILNRYGLNNGSTLGRHSGVADCISVEVDALPEVDAVDVVRCKDCKHGLLDDEFIRGRYYCMLMNHHLYFAPDFFCKGGEPRSYTPEHVVLCRDCKHFIPDTDDTQHGDCDVWSDRIWCDFFCGFGQRGINE